METLGAGPRLSAVLKDPILRTHAIRMLGRLALGRIDPVSRTIQVHRLVQALLQQEMTDTERAEFRNEVHLLLARAAPPDPTNERHWPRYAELVAHVAPAMIITSRDPEVRAFAVNMVRYLAVSGNSNQARTFCEEFLAHWLRIG